MKKVFVLSISNPLLVGVYDEGYNLLETYSKDGFASDVLAEIFDEILCKYKFDKVYFVNGPGSFMAIKVAFVFLRTICICNNTQLFAADGFFFNNNTQIKAIGKKVFIKNENGEISLENCDSQVFQTFVLPTILDTTIFSEDVSPKYYLPAV